jgi:hypothetical protein
MGSPYESPNGNTPVRRTNGNDTRRAGPITRGTSWLVNVAVPKLLPDRRMASLRERARNADDRLERTARRVFRRQVSRRPANSGRHTR